MEELGQVGVGTLIVFVAMVIVALIAAGVFVNTMGLLNPQPPGEETDTSGNNDNIEQVDTTEKLTDKSFVSDSRIVSIQLRSAETVVQADESASITFSSSALISAEDTVNVQLIIEAPSGVTVSSSAFSESGIGQYTTTYALEPGESKGIRMKMNANEPGRYDITGRAVYYVGNDKTNSSINTINIPLEVKSGS